MRVSIGLLTWVARSVLVGAAAAGLFPGCSGREANHGTDSGTMGVGDQPDGSPADPLILTAEHPGWRKQLCLGCHGQTAPYPHADAGYLPPICVSCHGYNGAPHTDHATGENIGCRDCHGDVDHVPYFKAPDDCVACHYHPSQP
jgi:hypothetical protein